MLVTLSEILNLAREKHCAVGAFNTPNLECITAVIRSAEELNVPVIISHAELHEAVSPIDIIGPVMIMAAKNARVPVCVHLDHATDLPLIEAAIRAGVSSVMYDGSVLPFEENAARTAEVVKIAHAAGVTLTFLFLFFIMNSPIHLYL